MSDYEKIKIVLDANDQLTEAFCQNELENLIVPGFVLKEISVGNSRRFDDDFSDVVQFKNLDDGTETFVEFYGHYDSYDGACLEGFREVTIEQRFVNFSVPVS